MLSKFNVLLLTIPLSFPAGAAIIPQRFFNGLLKNGINAAVITHWWDCSFEPGIRYNVITKDGYKPFFTTRDKVGSKLATVKKWRISSLDGKRMMIPSAIEPTTSRESAIEAGRGVAKKAVDYLLERGFKPDVIHAHTHTFTHDKTLSVIMNGVENPPLLFTLHAVIGEPRRVREKSQAETVAMADQLITISEGWKNKIESMYGRSCAFIHNATDYFNYLNDNSVERRANELRSSFALKKEKIIVFSGRVEHIKMQGLPKAFSSIAEKWDAVLVIVGDSGTERTKRNLVEWGMGKKDLKRVYFTGWINGISEEGRRELAAYYRMVAPSREGNQTTINGSVVMPARTEDHYGLSVLDALAMKVPVITCKGKLSTHGCMPGAEDLVEAMDFVFSHPQHVLSRIENAFDILKKEYSVMNYYVSEHIKLYRRAIAAKGDDFEEIVKRIRDKELEKRREGGLKGRVGFEEITERVRKKELERHKKLIETIRKKEAGREGIIRKAA